MSSQSLFTSHQKKELRSDAGSELESDILYVKFVWTHILFMRQGQLSCFFMFFYTVSCTLCFSWTDLFSTCVDYESISIFFFPWPIWLMTPVRPAVGGLNTEYTSNPPTAPLLEINESGMWAEKKAEERNEILETKVIPLICSLVISPNILYRCPVIVFLPGE